MCRIHKNSEKLVKKAINTEMNVYFCCLGLLAIIKGYITLSCSQIYLVKSQRTAFSSDQSLSLLSSLFVRANQNFGIPYDWLEMKTVAKFHLLQMHKKFIICYPTFLTFSGRFSMNFVQKLWGFFALNMIKLHHYS